MRPDSRSSRRVRRLAGLAAVDSDPSSATGSTVDFTLDPDEFDSTWDAGLLPTTSNAGADDTVDSDVNGGGETPLFTVTAGMTDLSIDAGFALPA